MTDNAIWCVLLKKGFPDWIQIVLQCSEDITTSGLSRDYQSVHVTVYELARETDNFANKLFLKNILRYLLSLGICYSIENDVKFSVKIYLDCMKIVVKSL